MVEVIRSIGKDLKKRIALYRLVLGDRRTPGLARALLCLAIGYTMLPFDIIPDFIPVIGHIDDAVIVPLLIYLALRMVPVEVINEHRATCGFGV